MGDPRLSRLGSVQFTAPLASFLIISARARYTMPTKRVLGQYRCPRSHHTGDEARRSSFIGFMVTADLPCGGPARLPSLVPWWLAPAYRRSISVPSGGCLHEMAGLGVRIRIADLCPDAGVRGAECVDPGWRCSVPGGDVGGPAFGGGGSVTGGDEPVSGVGPGHALGGPAPVDKASVLAGLSAILPVVRRN
jgi:hypothetical protein